MDGRRRRYRHHDCARHVNRRPRTLPLACCVALVAAVVGVAQPARAVPPPIPVMSVADTSFTEGTSLTSPYHHVTIPVVASPEAQVQTLIHYTVTPGTAYVGSDYVGNASGNLTFAPN